MWIFFSNSNTHSITVTKQHHKKQWLMIQTNRRTILDFRIRFSSTDWILQFLIILYLFRGLMEASLSLYRTNKTHTLTASHWHFSFSQLLVCSTNQNCTVKAKLQLTACDFYQHSVIWSTVNTNTCTWLSTCSIFQLYAGDESSHTSPLSSGMNEIEYPTVC